MRAIELDPLSPQILVDATMPLLFQRNAAGAKALARKAADLDPTYFFPVMIGGWADLDIGQFRNAIPALKQAKGMSAPPFVTAYLAFAYGASGDRAGAIAELADLKKMSSDGTVLPFLWRSSSLASGTTPARSTASSRHMPRTRR